MNKKGYTLVELIAVFVIIAVISTVVILNFDHSIDKGNEKKEKAFVADLEKAACIYIDLRDNKTIKDNCYPNCNVTTQELITGGIISDDLIDPSTNNAIRTDLTINVVWDANGEKICTFSRWSYEG